MKQQPPELSAPLIGGAAFEHTRISCSSSYCDLTVYELLKNGIDGYFRDGNLKIYNAPINYDNGTGYEPFKYGVCGSECFRDSNGLIYRIGGGDNKSYLNL